MFGSGPRDTYPHNIFLEFLYYYGFIGFVLFLTFLLTSLITAYKYQCKTNDDEARWCLSLLVLQLTAQQLSLDIFYGSLWAALVLPLGYGMFKYDQHQLIKIRI